VNDERSAFVIFKREEVRKKRETPISLGLVSEWWKDTQ
jgi:hypothetical protein